MGTEIEIVAMCKSENSSGHNSQSVFCRSVACYIPGAPIGFLRGRSEPTRRITVDCKGILCEQ